MRTAVERADEGGLAGLGIVRCRIDDGATGFFVDTLGPVNARHIGLCRQQLAVRRIEHIEETVLRRLHHHMTGLAIDGQIGCHDLIGVVVIPAFAGCGLVMPDVLTGVWLERDDGRQEQIVTAAG